MPGNPCSVNGTPALLGWHVLSGEHLLECLQQVAAGESPDMVFAELWANGRHDRIDENGEVVE